ALAETPTTGFPAPDATASSTTTTLPQAGNRTPLLNTVGMSATDAIRALRDAGYRIRLRSVPSRQHPPGTVVAQDPAAGGPANPGMTVTIDVVDGPPRSVLVPNALGAYADQAAVILRSAGFDVAIVVQPEPPPGSPERAGRVWKQTPISGAVADEGSTVTISVNPT
ncbi:MAG: PASTA domain-containing protein, partial [Acidimicrobiia bacterium]